MCAAEDARSSAAGPAELCARRTNSHGGESLSRRRLLAGGPGPPFWRDGPACLGTGAAKDRRLGGSNSAADLIGGSSLADPGQAGPKLRALPASGRSALLHARAGEECWSKGGRRRHAAGRAGLKLPCGWAQCRDGSVCAFCNIFSADIFLDLL